MASVCDFRISPQKYKRTAFYWAVRRRAVGIPYSCVIAQNSSVFCVASVRTATNITGSYFVCFSFKRRCYLLRLYDIRGRQMNGCGVLL